MTDLEWSARDGICRPPKLYTKVKFHTKSENSTLHVHPSRVKELRTFDNKFMIYYTCNGEEQLVLYSSTTAP